MTTPRMASIDRIKATYSREGGCEHCGDATRRSRTFTGSDLEEIDVQAERWERDPLLHAHCEGPYWAALKRSGGRM